MTTAETTAFLRRYNAWRRGEDETQPMPDPREIGLAIDAAVDMIDRLEAAEKDVALKERVIYALGSELNAVANERDALRAEVIHIKEVEFPRKAQAVADGWRGKLEAAEKERDNANAAAAGVALQAEALQAKLDAAEKSDAESLAMYRKARDARDTLQAKIEQMERQEPVASIYIDGKGDREFDDWKCDLPAGSNPLYALPGAKGEEK